MGEGSVAWSRFSHTDRLSSVNKKFIILQTRKYKLCNLIVTGLYKLKFCLRRAMS